MRQANTLNAWGQPEGSSRFPPWTVTMIVACPPGERIAREALTRTQSLFMHTAGAARQLHDAGSGTVRPGQRADLIVLDRDITKVPVKDIRDTQVRYTLISGRVVHDAESQTGRARTEAAQHIGAHSSGRTAGRSCCQGR